MSVTPGRPKALTRHRATKGTVAVHGAANEVSWGLCHFGSSFG